MDEKSLNAIEYDKMKQSVTEYAFSSLGVARVADMMPLTELSEARRAMAEADEAIRYSSLEDGLPFAGISDITEYLDRLDKDGVLIGTELWQVYLFLDACKHIVDGFDDAEKYPSLYGYGQGISHLSKTAYEIERAIDEVGEVKDNATPQLKRIRVSIAKKRDELRDALDRILKVPDMKKWLQDLIITQRNGRYVLPVRSDGMRSVKGIVHGRSASGATFFVEPIGIVNLNNDLEELSASEEEEVLRILRRLSFLLSDELEALYVNLEIVTELDFIAARAGYGSMLNGNAPQLVQSSVLRLKSARHPFLILNRDAEEVVPINVDIGVDYDGMIISGPNAGGKTVALKTAGLLTAMALSGIPIPASADSTIGAFTQILADIGDQSSIEGNLSTFTAHMDRIKSFLEEADGKSLILIDEIGVGTSPKYGVAISTAVIRQLKSTGARLLVTTHYDDLKIFALDEEGFINAAVEFDAETLQPRYNLIPGRPGSSEAIAILKRMEFPDELIKAAKEILGEEEASLADLLTQLEEKTHQATDLTAEMEMMRDKYEDQLQNLDAQKREVETHASSSKKEAYSEAAKILKDARRQASMLIRELKETDDLQSAEKIRSQLGVTEREMKQERERLKTDFDDDITEVFVRPGQAVKVRGTATSGEVVEIMPDKGRAIIKFGGLTANVNLADLIPVKKKKAKTSAKTPTSPDISPSLKLLGMTGDEAEVEIDRYLDMAARAGLESVEVVHGHGTGRLRIAVHAFLRRHPLVSGFGLQPGNDGATEVTLRK